MRRAPAKEINPSLGPASCVPRARKPQAASDARPGWRRDHGHGGGRPGRLSHTGRA